MRIKESIQKYNIWRIVVNSRIFRDTVPGEVWTWGETICYTLLLVFSLGFAFKEYRHQIGNEFGWSFFGGLWILFLVCLLFFAPMILLSPISIPGFVIYLHRNQTKEAKKIVINALKAK